MSEEAANKNLPVGTPDIAARSAPHGVPATQETTGMSSLTNRTPGMSSPPNAASPQRRSFLQAVAWGGGIAGLGGLTGLTIARLTRKQAAAPTRKPVLGNEFTYDVARFQKSDPALLRYEETSRFASGLKCARALALANDNAIFVGGSDGIRKFSATGEPALKIPLDKPVYSIALRPSGEILVGQLGKICVLDASGAELAVWSGLPENLLPTSIALAGERVFVADAANRVVLKLNSNGKKLGIIGARDPARNLKGFVVPSPFFCVRMAPDGLLRIANPGEHQIEAFTLDGDLEVAWGQGSFAVAGFCGCCNPVSFDIFPDGSFVTCEKGLPRVKLYNSDGEFTGLVAGPDAFPEYLQAANAGTTDALGSGVYAAIDPQGRVLVLDSVSGVIRIMQRKPLAHD
ncbi:MAG: hypothetical protein WCP35_00755 [Verrucomicrobiota bacterium]